MFVLLSVLTAELLVLNSKSHLTSAASAVCGVPSALSAAQKTSSLNAHNDVRRVDGADQIPLSWDDRLAARAQEWANKCDYSHQYLTDCQNARMGQNLYMSQGLPLVMAAAVQLWAGERENWNFDSETCTDGTVCGHWTQLVWSRTSRVGCGYKLCPLLTQTNSDVTWKNALLIVCDYSSAGNFGNEKPFQVGAPCSACPRVSDVTPGAKCVKNLCVPCSPTPKDPLCLCGSVTSCLNRGSWNKTTCRCDCLTRPIRFYGPDCSKACLVAEGWATSCVQYAGQGYCTDAMYRDFMETKCAAVCPYCK